MVNIINICSTILVFWKFCAAAEPEFAKAVYCGVQNSVLVETDPIEHRYIPFITKLPQCGGAIGLHQPSVKKCVKKTYENVSYKVNIIANFMVKTLTLEKHTSCRSVCVLDKSVCDVRFQTWNSVDCKCDCKYSAEPKVSPCSAPQVWKQRSCSCGCSSLPTKCPEKKEWSEDVCACMCSKRYMNRCARKNKVVSQESCTCVEPTIKYINKTSAARQDQTRCSGVAGKIVVMIVVLEFLFLLSIFFLVYRCYLRYDPELDPNTSSLKRMKYEINKMRTITRRKKHNAKPSIKESEHLKPNGVQQSLTIQKSDYEHSEDFDFQEVKDLSPLDRDEPVGFYPDRDPYDTCESETYTAETGQVTIV